MAERVRLDQAIEARGLLPSRARARDAVLRGTVRVNGVAASKPHQPVTVDDVIMLDDPAADYVSRSAMKLIAALDAAQIVVDRKTCLDLGASTGGFTQVLLERGAVKVFAVDVGHDQFDPRLVGDPRVVSLEGRNARDLDRDVVPEPIDVLVCDVSFVSVTKILAAPLALCAADASAVVLFKPQFEVGREAIGKGGIVRDTSASAAATSAVTTFMAEAGWQHRMSIDSPIAGGDGNQETLLVFDRRSVSLD